MPAPLIHGVRSLEEERDQHRRGEALSTATDAVVGARMMEMATDHRGSLDEYSGPEKALLKDLALCDVITETVIAELARRGSILDADGAPLPVLKCLATFMNTKRLHAVVLGLARRQKDAGDLQSYLADVSPVVGPTAGGDRTPTDDAGASLHRRRDTVERVVSPRVSILQAMADPKLFGTAYAGSSWDAWRAFLAALFGLRMSKAQLAIYQRHSGRQTPPSAPFREAWVIAGRRAGKSRIAALVAVYLATIRDWSPYLAPGEQATVMVLAADKRQARVIFKAARALLTRVPLLERLLIGETRESLTLSNNVVIEIHAISQARTRGYTLAAVLADECCFWPEGPDGESAAETIAALRPALASLPGSLLLPISSPWAKRGVAFDQHVKHHGVEGSPVLTWLGSTLELNPTFDPDTVKAAMEADAVSARTEYGAAWRDDCASYVSREQLFACVVDGRVSLPPQEGRTYVAGLDAAGGSGKDSMTMAVAHLEGERAVLDLVVERRPPFSPPSVAAEFAAILKQYRVGRVEADRYAGDWPKSALAQHSVTLEHCSRNRSECYLELLPAISAQRLELLDDERMLKQGLALERRAGRLRDVVDHPPGAHHDDIFNAAAIALLCALEARHIVDVMPMDTYQASTWGERIPLRDFSIH